MSHRPECAPVGRQLLWERLQPRFVGGTERRDESRLKPLPQKTQRTHQRQHQRGLTLIDVIGVLLLLSLCATALLAASSRLSAQTAEALQTRAALAFSQSVLEEVLNVPFASVSAYQGQSVAASGAQLNGCTATVRLTATALPGVPANDAWQVHVATTCPGRATVGADGLRIRP